MVGRSAALAVILFGCADDSTLFAEKAWPSDHQALVAITDDTGRLLIDEPIMLSAGEDLQRLVEADNLIISVMTYLPELDIASCTPTFGSGAPLPPPNSLWTSGLIDVATQPAVSFAPASTADVPGIRAATRCDAVSLCARATITEVDLTGVEPAIDHIEVLSSTRAAFMMSDGDILFDTPDGTEIVRADPELMGEADDLLDIGTVLVGSHDADAKHQLFRMTPQGRYLDIWDSSELFSGIVGSRTGRVLAVSRPGSLIELDLASRLWVPADSPPDELDAVRFGDDGRLFALTASVAFRLWTYDGTTWRAERTLMEKPDSLSTGSGQFVVAQPAPEPLLIRTAQGFTELARPSRDDLTVEPLAEGRILAGAERGVVHLFDGDTWCTLQTPDLLRINRVDSSPDGTFSFIASKFRAYRVTFSAE